MFMNLSGYIYYRVVIFKEVYIIFVRTFTQLWNLYLSESYTYYNVIFKSKNVLYIIHNVYFYNDDGRNDAYASAVIRSECSRQLSM